MPELPEVEAARRRLEQHCVGKKIIEVIAQPDEKVFEGITPERLRSSLLGKLLKHAHRKGKHCWLEFEGGNLFLLLHFGMTGGTAVQGKGGDHYQRYSVDDSQGWPPRFCKLQLHFEDGTQWAFSDSRRFARIRLFTEDPLTRPPLNALGWDPLLSMPALEEFTRALARERRAIKALLLDQSFSSGVGNWVADEVLFQARIHPEQPANTLHDDEIEGLHRAIYSVCKTAADANSDATQFPENWLFHHRWSKGSASKSKVMGHALAHITVGGRTSAYVPALQKLRKSAGTAVKKKEGTEKVADERISVATNEKTVVTVKKVPKRPSVKSARKVLPSHGSRRSARLSQALAVSGKHILL